MRAQQDMAGDDLLDTYRRLETTEEELHTCQHVLVHTQKQLAELQEQNEKLRAELAAAQRLASQQVRAPGKGVVTNQAQACRESESDTHTHTHTHTHTLAGLDSFLLLTSPP